GAGGRPGHSEAGADRAGRQRLQVLLLLLGRRDVLQQVHVALVWSGAVEGERSEQAGPGLLEGDGDAAPVQPKSAEVLWKLRPVDAGLTRLLPQLADDVP